MNLSLQDPLVIAQDLPDGLEFSLKAGHSIVVRFNHRGDLLASGRTDGKIVIFDWDTHGVAKKLKGHSTQVNAVSWSQDDRILLSASLDWTVILWDLQIGEKLHQIHLTGPCLMAEINPLDTCQFVAALFEQDPVLVNIIDDQPQIQSLISIPKQPETQIEAKKTKKAVKYTTTVALFWPKGDFILAGTNNGWINIYQSSNGQLLCSLEVSNSLVRHLKLSTAGKYMVVSCHDRNVRQYEMPDLSAPGFDFETFHIEPEGKIFDPINKTSYNHITCSRTGEYVIVSENQSKTTPVYERGANGLTLLTMFDPPEEIQFLEWHPHKASVCAVASEGKIFVYSYLTPQRWSALAPDFVEVEENQEYIEKEDEFDIYPAEELNQQRLDLENEDIDVLTMDEQKPGQWQQGDFAMPVLLDEDNSESEDDLEAIGAGQYRRKMNKSWAEDDSEAVPSGDESRKQVAGVNVSSSRNSSNGPKRKRNID